MKQLALVFALMGGISVLTACGTVSGIGEDVQSAGSAVTDASQATSKAMTRNGDCVDGC